MRNPKYSIFSYGNYLIRILHLILNLNLFIHSNKFMNTLNCTFLNIFILVSHLCFDYIFGFIIVIASIFMPMLISKAISFVFIVLTVQFLVTLISIFSAYLIIVSIFWGYLFIIIFIFIVLIFIILTFSYVIFLFLHLFIFVVVIYSSLLLFTFSSFIIIPLFLVISYDSLCIY